MGFDDLSALKNLVRVGTVSSVDVDKRLVRVVFADKQDTGGKPFVSAPLKVLQCQPLITVEQWVEEAGEDVKWDYGAAYNTHDRKLGLGESYVKRPYAALADVINNEKVIQYEKRETVSEGSPIACTCGATASSCPLHGVIERKKHRQTVTVHPWLPYIGQLVVCLFLPNGEGDGFVTGGI